MCIFLLHVFFLLLLLLLHDGAGGVGARLETVFGAIFLEKLELLRVERAPSLRPNELHGLFVAHAELHEGESDHDWRSAQAGHAVDGHARVGRLAELLLEQVEPVFADLGRRRLAVGKGGVNHFDAFFFQFVSAVGRVTDADNYAGIIFVQLVNVAFYVRVGRSIRDEKAHVLVLDLRVLGSLEFESR